MSDLVIRDLIIARGTFQKGPLNHSFGRPGLHLIQGKNGSGKSTLFKTLLGRIPARAGEIIGFRERQIGIVGIGQTFVGSWSLEKNIRFLRNLGNFTKGSSLNDLQRIFQLPFSKRFDQFSLGQRRKIELLFWLDQKLPLYFFDEALNSLDKDERSRVGEVMKDLSSHCVFLMTSHHEDEIPFQPVSTLSL